jgi:hypothetical protein
MTVPVEQVSPWPVRMRRADASRYLEIEHGIRLAVQTLARLAVEGCGPPYRLYSRMPLYERAALDEWAESRLTPAAASTAAHKVALESASAGREAGATHREPPKKQVRKAVSR